MIEATSIDKISERQILQCVDEWCKREVNGEQLYLIDQDIRGVSRHMRMVDAEDGVCTLHSGYCNVLQRAGYGDLPMTKPHLAFFS